MKWKEVKILCAGMCVCTVIAAATAMWGENTEKGQSADVQTTEMDAAAMARTEMLPEVEVERHEVYEVGSGEATGSAIALGEGAGVDGVESFALNRPEEEHNLIIADVTNYVNIRSLPSEEGEILGKLYDNSVGRKLGEENGWYHIESGSVTGYVKAEFVLTGEAAVTRAEEVGTRLAEVTTTTLKVRQHATTDSAVLGLVPGGDILNVLEEVEGWVKVDVEDGPGYVSTNYVNVYTENVEAESKAEEAARLKKEEEERRRAEEAAKEALKQQQAASKPSSGGQSNSNSATGTGNTTNGGTNSGSNSGGSGSNSSSSSTSNLGQQIADYALKFLGNPYVYGGTSLTNGADCSGFVQSVYKHFGISLPRTSGEQGKSGRAVDGLENAKPGDLIWYSGHIGIYIGNGKIVHASNPKNGIITSNATYRTILGIRRIV
ncbi:MAG: C40 family peptidase [Roseburia sp.]|nr:C40 family peptidase [Roseburia sp.]